MTSTASAIDPRVASILRELRRLALPEVEAVQEACEEILGQVYDEERAKKRAELVALVGEEIVDLAGSSGRVIFGPWGSAWKRAHRVRGLERDEEGNVHFWTVCGNGLTLPAPAFLKYVRLGNAWAVRADICGRCTR